MPDSFASRFQSWKWGPESIVIEKEVQQDLQWKFVIKSEAVQMLWKQGRLGTWVRSDICK